MYNQWFSNEVATHLNQSVHPTELKIISKLSDLKPLHASWIVDLYEHLKKRNRDDHGRFRFRGDYRDNNVQSVYEKTENSFRSP